MSTKPTPTPPPLGSTRSSAGASQPPGQDQTCAAAEAASAAAAPSVGAEHSPALTNEERAEDPRPNPGSGPISDDGAAEPRPTSPVGYQVQLPAFEGPLDLLLHLIQQHELDILDIPIAFVTEKYVAYIKLMQQLNIDLASEYLVMAATLAHIKSKMLLPAAPDDEEDADLEPEVDPRAELVRRLLEYQKYRDAGAQLAERPLLGRDVFVRGIPAPASGAPAPFAPVSLFKLLETFQSIIDRAEIRMDHQVEFERFSITDRISELSDVLRARPRVPFEELFAQNKTRSELIITFLALLEMTRLRMTRLLQEGPLDPIFVELAVLDDGELGDLTEDDGGSLSAQTDSAPAASSGTEAGPLGADGTPARLDHDRGVTTDAGDGPSSRPGDTLPRPNPDDLGGRAVPAADSTTDDRARSDLMPREPTEGEGGVRETEQG